MGSPRQTDTMMILLVIYVTTTAILRPSVASGSGNTGNVYQEVDYYHIGCFKDTRNRTMPELLGTWRGSGKASIKICAKATRSKGYKVFGVQYSSECWSGVNASLTYAKYGNATNCRNGIGGDWANDVYFFYTSTSTTNPTTYITINTSTSATKKVLCKKEKTGNRQIKGLFTWEASETGETRIVACPLGPDGSNATRTCGGNVNTGAEWNTPDDESCQYKSQKTNSLHKLSKIKLSSSNAKEIARNFTELFKSGSAKDLSEADATLAADMVAKIIKIDDQLNETAGQIVEVIDVVMEMVKSNLPGNTCTRIIKSLDKLVEKIPLDEGTTSRVLKRTNLAIQANEVTRSTFKGFTFGIKKNKAGGPYGPSVTSDADHSSIFVKLPNTILQNSKKTSNRIGFIYYANNKLFQSNPQDGRGQLLISNEVISSSVYNESIQNLTDPVSVAFSKLRDNDGNPGSPTSCVFWDVSQRQWSSLGCTLHKRGDIIGNQVECHCNHLTSFSVVFAFGSVIVNQETVTNVTVKEGEDIRINCTNNDQGEGQWKNEDGTDIELSSRIKVLGTILVITNSSTKDAGVYKCLKGKNTHIVNLRVNVTINVKITLRILNWNFTNEIQDKTTPAYKKFEANFHRQMDELYKNLEGYVGVEILEIYNGSVKVRFRVIVVVTVKTKNGKTTYNRVVVTQRVINEAKTGWVKNLKVDPSPDELEVESPPPQPENVTLVEVTDKGAEIAWDKPKNHEYYGIRGYLIEYWIFSTSNTKKQTGMINGQRYKITGLKDETAYVARVVGMNKDKGQESDHIDIKTKKAVLAGWIIALIVIFCILILLFTIALIIYLCRRKKMQEKSEKQADMFSMNKVNREKFDKEEKGAPHVRSYSNTMYNLSDCTWTHFPREDLVLMEELGSGEFGVVHKGQMMQNGEVKECAVKTLKDAFNTESYRQLYQELEIMASVGHHPNLVNLIGSTSEKETLFVIVEFARHGSLIEYLRNQRLKPEAEYGLELNYTNRLGIALDVAKGMAHLERKRCVHRDLAARNILLADNFVAKVSDFGLSRDIYETGEYEKTSGGKLPTRWMALESLELRRFTLKTDVWSFGVLLWEIETRGLMPHGAISYIELLKKLKEGYRLERPERTPDELYNLMQNCWAANPCSRPRFSQICDILETMFNSAHA